jgi:decaprenylphospho-beta-D-ribofuranose 2-oxidase
VLTQGDHAPASALVPAEREDRARALAFAPVSRLAAPPLVPSGLLNRWSIRAFDEAWFRRAPRRRLDEVQTIPQFFHPLDGVQGWNRLYGARGLVQHQCVVPHGREDVLHAILAGARRARIAPTLAVLKRLGPATRGAPLSFPMAGWTLALDLPAGARGLARLLDGWDDLVAAAGGRVYLAKDARMSAETVRATYPGLDAWRAARERLDPAGAMRSDLARRLELAA